MKKLFILIVLLAFTAPVFAADVNLTITVPDAWVSVTIEAVQNKWPIPDDFMEGQAQGVRVKKWTETKLRAYLRNIVAPYKTRQDQAAALVSAGFVGTSDEDIPIEISE